jgi:hypothetical protein
MKQAAMVLTTQRGGNWRFGRAPNQARWGWLSEWVVRVLCTRYNGQKGLSSAEKNKAAKRHGGRARRGKGKTRRDPGAVATSQDAQGACAHSTIKARPWHSVGTTQREEATVAATRSRTTGATGLATWLRPARCRDVEEQGMQRM